MPALMNILRGRKKFMDVREERGWLAKREVTSKRKGGKVVINFLKYLRRKLDINLKLLLLSSL